MTEEAKTLSEKARRLSPAERIELVDSILASLHDADPAVEQLWAKEAADRLAAYRRGEIKAVERGAGEVSREVIVRLLEIAQLELDETVSYYNAQGNIRRCRLQRFPYGLIYSATNEECR